MIKYSQNIFHLDFFCVYKGEDTKKEVRPMDDSEILDLYFARSEQAIVQTDQKYGPYCYSIACHILSNPADAEESVNDTYFTAWKLIPPRRPQRLAIFLGKLTRNLSIDRWRRNTAGKRGGGETQLLLDELAECVTGAESPETELMRKELTASLNRFLRSLPKKDQTVFLLRYYYANSQGEVAQKTGLSPNQVKYILQRTRKNLAATLQKEGLA